MAATLKKGFGKLGQRTGELLGRDSSNKTDFSEEFKDLQTETDNRHSGTESTQAALALYTSQLLKKKEATDNSRQKLHLLENLGSSMISLGSSLPRDSNYGRALESLGQVQERMNDSQLQFVSQIKEGWGSSLESAMDDFKQYTALKKKLETRRSDYDSKNAKFQKSRRDNVQLEDELRSAQTRYEDTYDEMAQRMMHMQDAEQGYLEDLYGFYEAQLSHYQMCHQMLDDLRPVLEECLSARRPPAADRNPIGSTVSSRRSATSLRANDYGGGMPPARRPIPFSHSSSQSLSRSASYRAPPSRANRNGSQYSDNSDDAQAQFSYAHGIDTTPDTGGLEGSLAVPQSSTRQIPQLARVQTESSVLGRRAVPAPPPPSVAPRRHAPPPPAPMRTPQRVLRRTLYKFAADEMGELPLAVGDIIEVIERVDDGWWNGTLLYSPSTGKSGQTGLFPANYTEECDESDIPPKLPTKAPATPLSATRPNNDPFQSSYNPPAAHRSQTSPDDPQEHAAYKQHQHSHQRTASHATHATKKPCACGCDDYSPNLFKKGNCTNCFHNH
ncbi:hypothetical protein GGI12_000033 [Dipsacomyces acuminosporus]|nr:hypothetical protein GGI12_000033 [Dipsacomyces acuminosporus]